MSPNASKRKKPLILYCLAAALILTSFLIIAVSIDCPSSNRGSPAPTSLTINGITFPYNNAIRSALKILWLPFHNSSPTLATVSGNVVIPAREKKRNQLIIRQADATLHGFYVPARLEANIAALKDGDSVSIVYGMSQDPDLPILDRFEISSLQITK